MVMRILITLLFIFPVYHTKLNSLDYSQYTYLHFPHTSFHYNLSKYIFLERKQFRDIWIYNNGFVTIGHPLDEENYPKKTDGGHDQSFEDMIGYNIIAVFITANEMTTKSIVRAREISILADEFKNSFEKITQTIKHIYGKYLISSLDHAVEVEWLHMKPLGTSEDIENSFRLLLISTKHQTFCIFQYTNITSSTYKISGQKFQYQSGLTTFKEMKYKFSMYDPKDEDIPLQKSSNIGIRNTWIITMGDTSYNIDMGWSIYHSKRKTIKNGRNLKFKNRNNEFKNFTEKNLSTFSIKPSESKLKLKNDYKSASFLKLTTVNNNILRMKSLRSKSEKVVTSTKISYLNVDDHVSLPKVTHGNSWMNFTSTKPNDFAIQKGTYSTESTTNIATLTVRTEKAMLSNYQSNEDERKSSMFFTKIKHNIPSNLISGRKDKLMKTYERFIKNTKKPVEISILSGESNKKYQRKKMPAREIRPHTLSNMNNGFNSYRQNLSQTVYLNTSLNNSLVTVSPSEKLCSFQSCKENEECFISNQGACCRCKIGTSSRNRKCSRNDIPFIYRLKGTVNISTKGQIWKLDLHLVLNKKASLIDDYLRAHITLLSDDNLDQGLRNFLLLLYPLFHIPMAFYASPWGNDMVPNLSSFVEQEAGFNIFVAIGSYEDIYISFQIERKNNEDKWTIFLNGIDMIMIKNLNIPTLRLDEKSTEIYNLVYVLSNRNSVEFPEQSVTFHNENGSKSLKVKWRGLMTFSGTCLSNYIGTKKYFVKFSDKRYCNSDCQKDNVNKKYCRVMCLSSPHVFDYKPKPCQGNFCEISKICINNENNYECKCLEGFYEKDSQCVRINFVSTNISFTRNKIYDSSCLLCSPNADCQIINSDSCCTCKNGYLGSGRVCVEKNSQIELVGIGILSISHKTSSSPLEYKIQLLFRQFINGNKINYKSLIEFDNFPYKSVKEQQLLQFILLLSPLFDVPMGIFSTNSNNTYLKNIYTLSRGLINITILIHSNFLSPIEIRIFLNQQSEYFELQASVIGFPEDFNPNMLLNSIEHFNNRVYSKIRYTIENNKIVFKKHNINLPNKIHGQEIWWQGTGSLHKCADYFPMQQNVVILLSQYNCDARCKENVCKPFCENIPTIHESPKRRKCVETCNSNARCLDGSCVCFPGFSGNGISCLQIKKNLECRHSRDCKSKPFTECQNYQCTCKLGYTWHSNECRLSDNCSFCQNNEECKSGKCVCTTKFVRNRISKNCVYDCSLCDDYSTICNDNGCICKPGFSKNNSNSNMCDLDCSSDFDCPTNEKCSQNKICYCPYDKNNNICIMKSICNECHKKAICEENNCICQGHWIGNGISCIYNCSLCFNINYCNSEEGCSCPPGFIGNGITCIPNKCNGICPKNSKCEIVQNEYRCICNQGLLMISGECIHDTIELNILPPDRNIEIVEGSPLDIICLGISRLTSFELKWSRKSGKRLKGIQEFADSTNRTLRLKIRSVKLDENDQYICSTNSSEQAQINISIVVKACNSACSKFAYCENGECRCQKNYFGNGTYCSNKRNCIQKCSSNEICDENTGRCKCQSGFIYYKNKCLADCRKNDICNINAICNKNNGFCECQVSFVGNGTNCWKGDRNCLFTKHCSRNSNCSLIEGLNQHVCLCNQGYIGDGSETCYKKIDCGTYQCSPNAICETVMIKNAFGNHYVNGKCSCVSGYVLVNNICREIPNLKDTLWLSMGESLISHTLGTNGSKIQYIDQPTNNEVSSIITYLSGYCEKRLLIWSGQNGQNIRSSNPNNFTNTKTHLSNLGKVTGISVDQETGNVFYSDSYKGKIGVFNIENNISRVLINLEEYSPGPIVTHSQSGKIFWIVNDYQNPRIESADMTGENRNIFISMNNTPISLVLANDNDLKDRLCWVEINSNMKQSKKRSVSPFKGFLKCATIDQKHTPLVVTTYPIRTDEPFSALEYFDQKFYWNVRKGKYIKMWSQEEDKLKIKPNCCDVTIRSLFVLADDCNKRSKFYTNPCSKKALNGKCSELCLPRSNAKEKLESVCFSSNV